VFRFEKGRKQRIGSQQAGASQFDAIAVDRQ
jgi:hypothetical protein